MAQVLIDTKNKLKIAVLNAINQGIENGDFPQADIPEFSIEVPADAKTATFRLMPQWRAQGHFITIREK